MWAGETEARPSKTKRRHLLLERRLCKGTGVLYIAVSRCMVRDRNDQMLPSPVFHEVCVMNKNSQSECSGPELIFVGCHGFMLLFFIVHPSLLVGDRHTAGLDPDRKFVT